MKPHSDIFRLKPNVLEYDQLQTDSTVAQMMDKTFANNGELLRHNERPEVRKLYFQMLMRMRSVFGYFEKGEKSSWSRFSSLLAKTCPLPSNYRTVSLLAHSFHKNSPEQNAWTFNQLYSNSSRYSSVSRALVGAMKMILPPELLGPSNSQVLYEAIGEFVQMKRF